MRGVSEGTRLLMTTDAVGGVWRYALDAYAELSARGVEASLIGLGPRPSPAQEAEAAAVGVPLAWIDRELDWSAPDYQTLCGSGRALADEVRRRQPDIVHLNSPALLPFLDPGTIRFAAAHSCLATWWHAMKDGPLPAAWMWHYEAASIGLASADLVTAPSGAFAEALRKTYGGLPALQVVHNCARPVRPQAKQAFVLSAGRWWDESKNLRTLDAAARLARSPVYAAGPLRGPGSETAEPADAAWLGDLPHAEFRDTLARARVFTSLSLYEPFGLAVLEAATAGAALVLADIPTFRELWGSCALFVDPTDPEAVAQALDRVCDDPNVAAWLGAAARIRSRAYTRRRQGDALMAAYGSVLDRAVAV